MAYPINQLKDFLDGKAIQYNHPSFLAVDPIGIPRRFSLQQDIEIAGFFAAILAWGTRKGIINSCNKLIAAMNNTPYQFIMQTDWDKEPEAFNVFNGFVHRTFNDMDLWHLMNFLQHHYRNEQSLETAFTQWMRPGDETIENALSGFHNYVFGYSEDAAAETHCRKHIASPVKKSACKRLNMYLRWMVRKDIAGVDFGIWKNISPAQLVIPIDVHVSRVSQRLGILHRTQNDWQAAMELTQYLKELDADDPVKYDFALFGLGVMEKY
jgi:uncharacterized protein (TIGR02757 family)